MGFVDKFGNLKNLSFFDYPLIRYINEKKVPPSLFYKQFPRPFWPHDPAFVDSYCEERAIKLCRGERKS